MKSLRKFLALFLVLLSSIAYSQGFRYGAIEYTIESQDLNQMTVRFDIKMEWDGSSIFFTYQNPLPSVGTSVPLPIFYFGDGNAGSTNMMVNEVEVVCGNTIYRGNATLTHTYDLTDLNNRPPFAASTQYPGRAVELTDGNGSNDYRLLTIVNPLGEGYNSPTYSPPSVFTVVKPSAGTRTDTIHLVADVDTGGTNVSFIFPPANESGLMAANAQTLSGVPVFFTSATIAPATLAPVSGGQEASANIPFSVSSTTATGVYAVQLGVIDVRGSAPIDVGTSVADFIVRIVDTCDLAVEFDEPPTPPSQTFTVYEGVPFSLTMRTSVTSTSGSFSADISTTSLIDGMSIVGANIPNPDPNTTTYEEVLTWTPTAAQVGNNYSLAATAKGVNCNLQCNIEKYRNYKFIVEDQPPACQTTILERNCDPIGAPLTFYKGVSRGFDLQAITTSASSTAGKGKPIWSTGDTTFNIFVVPTVTTTYSVTVTDDDGCVSTASTTILVEDISACNKCTPIIKYASNGNNGSNDDDDDDGDDDDDDGDDDDDDGGNCNNNNKVKICHIPPGNPANAHTIMVSQNALAAHLAHGDVLGGCDDNCKRVKYNKRCKVKLCKTSGYGCKNGPRTVKVKSKHVSYFLSTGRYTLGPCSTNKNEPVYDLLFDMAVMPNPSTGSFTLSYELFENTQVSIEVIDFQGRVMYSESLMDSEGLHEHHIDLENAAAGIYMVNLTAYGEVWTKKIQVIK